MIRRLLLLDLCFVCHPHAADSPWWHQMFSLSFDGPGLYIAPHLEALNTTFASSSAIGTHGVWQADLARDAMSMKSRSEPFAKFF